jgi:VWFA-related protein
MPPRAHPLALAVTVAAALAAPAQDAPQTGQPTFTTEANYVRVDLYPTANGQPLADLTAEEFEIFEDGVAQKIAAFDRVVVAGPGAVTPTEPGSVAQSRLAVENPRARVFVLFIDSNHIELDAARNIRQPLVTALNRLIAPEDLVAVMTPKMSATDVTFARRPASIEALLARYWDWAARDRVTPLDPRELDYQICYPGTPSTPVCPDHDLGIADEMIARYREKQSIEALEDLVVYLRGIREERKAVLFISDGFLLFGQNPALSRRVGCDAPLPRTGIDPQTGRLRTNAQPVMLDVCERDRQVLATIDNGPVFRNLLDQANRANVTFYPVDPRGLAVFDTSIGVARTGLRAPDEPNVVPVSVDRKLLETRLGTLTDLAVATDGLAVVRTNQLDAGLERITDDLSSYYLVGYYSTGRLDGRFHSIRVRVKRPGVQVRARRGYQALRLEDVSRTSRGAASAASTAVAHSSATAIASALAAVTPFARDVSFRVAPTSGWKPGGVGGVWITADLAGGWKVGGEVSVTMTAASGNIVGSGTMRVTPGSRSVRIEVIPATPLTPGDYQARIRAQPDDGAERSATEIVSLTLAGAPTATGAILVRRGQATGNRDVATADRRFRRNEQLRVEVPDPSDAPASGRLLDRTGAPLGVPVTAATRVDTDGTRWSIVQVALAPLAPGDYIVELTGSTMVAFRVIP